MIKEIRDWVVGIIYLAQLQLGALNTVLLVLITITSNVDRIKIFVPWNTFTIVVIFWPLGFISIVLLSVFMDKVVGYARVYTSFANSRNPEITELLEKVRKIEERSLTWEKNK